MAFKPKTFFVFLLLAFATACKKDPEPAVYPTFMPLATGNYWVYQRFLVDTNGQSTAQNIFDSCYIEKDTLINAHTYYKFVKPVMGATLQTSYIRDSLHYLVNKEGTVLFSSEDFTNEMNSRYLTMGTDTMCHLVHKMTDKDLSLHTPAGVFVTSDARETYYMYPNYTFGNSSEKIRHLRYSEGVGPVMETMPLPLMGPYYERWLVRYSVQ